MDALKKGNKTGFEISEFIRKLDKYETVNGHVTTTTNNEIRFQVVLKTIKNGKVELYKNEKNI